MICDKKHKIFQYAEDTTLTLDCSSKTLFAALDTLYLFYILSRLKTNSLKTNIICPKEVFKPSISSFRWKLEWRSTTFNLFGVEFSVESENNLN